MAIAEQQSAGTPAESSDTGNASGTLDAARAAVQWIAERVDALSAASESVGGANQSALAGHARVSRRADVAAHPAMRRVRRGIDAHLPRRVDAEHTAARSGADAVVAELARKAGVAARSAVLRIAEHRRTQPSAELLPLRALHGADPGHTLAADRARTATRPTVQVVRENVDADAAAELLSLPTLHAAGAGHALGPGRARDSAPATVQTVDEWVHARPGADDLAHRARLGLDRDGRSTGIWSDVRVLVGTLVLVGTTGRRAESQSNEQEHPAIADDAAVAIPRRPESHPFGGGARSHW